MWHLENDGLSSASFSISITRRTFNNMYSSDCYIPSSQLSSQTSAFFTVLGWAFRVSQSTIMEPPRHGLVSVIYLKRRASTSIFGTRSNETFEDTASHGRLQSYRGLDLLVSFWSSDAEQLPSRAVATLLCGGKAFHHRHTYPNITASLVCLPVRTPYKMCHLVYCPACRHDAATTLGLRPPTLVLASSNGIYTTTFCASFSQRSTSVHFSSTGWKLGG